MFLNKSIVSQQYNIWELLVIWIFSSVKQLYKRNILQISKRREIHKMEILDLKVCVYTFSLFCPKIIWNCFVLHCYIGMKMLNPPEFFRVEFFFSVYQQWFIQSSFMIQSIVFRNTYNLSLYFSLQYPHSTTVLCRG